MFKIAGSIDGGLVFREDRIYDVEVEADVPKIGTVDHRIIKTSEKPKPTVTTFGNSSKLRESLFCP